MSMQHVQDMLLFLVLAVDSDWFQIYGVTHSGVAKGRAWSGMCPAKVCPAHVCVVSAG